VPPKPVVNEQAPHEVLGVSANATIEEITAAYRQMAQMYHPDKVTTLGPEFRELAERKMKEINKAYEALKKRG
jgi:DnaJ like chaperone protein